MPGIRICLVDDHLLVREALRAFFSRVPDLEVVADAHDAPSAHRAIEETRPDVVILDIVFAGASGVAIASEILRRNPGQRVVFLSMFTSDDMVARALQSGAHGYVYKTQPASALADAIRIVCGGGRYLPPGFRPPGPPAKPLDRLGRRERDVFDLMLQGLSNDAIARCLHITRRTVETHRSHLMKKLGLRSLSEVFHFALRQGLLNASFEA